jgi:hypothetical protein
MAQPLIIEYTNLLHQYRSPEAEPVKKFLRENGHDAVFLRRARALNRLFRLKEQLINSGSGQNR